MDPEVIQYRGDNSGTGNSAAEPESPVEFNLVGLIGSNSETTTPVTPGNREVAGTGTDDKQTGVFSFTSAVQSAIRAATGAAGAAGAAGSALEPTVRTAVGTAAGVVGGATGATAIRTAADAAGAPLEPTIRTVKDAAGLVLESLLQGPLLKASEKEEEIQSGATTRKRSFTEEIFRQAKASRGQFELQVSPNLKAEQMNYLNDLDAKLQNEHPNMSAGNRNLLKQGMAHAFNNDGKAVMECVKQMGGNIEAMKALATEMMAQGLGPKENKDDARRRESAGIGAEGKRTSYAEEIFQRVAEAKGEFKLQLSPNLNAEQKNYLNDLDAKLQKEHPDMSAAHKHLVKQGMAHAFSNDQKELIKCVKQMGGNLETLKALGTEMGQKGFFKKPESPEQARAREAAGFPPEKAKKLEK